MRQFDFPSSSSDKIYHTLINDNGLLSCDCPGWTVKKLNRPRFCKHCQKVAQDENLTLVDRDGQMFVIAAGTTNPYRQRYVSGAASTEGVQSSPSPAHGDRTAAPPTSIQRQIGASKVKVSAGLQAGTSNPAPSQVTSVTSPGAQAQSSGFINPMLASAMIEGKQIDRDFGRVTIDNNGTNPEWTMEEKFDGHRLVVRVEHEEAVVDQGVVEGFYAIKVTAWSRLGNTRTLPLHIKDLMEQMPVGVYDGELIVPTSQHSYSVTAGQSTGLEALVLFDMLEVDDNPLMGEPFGARRQMLEIAFSALDGTDLPIFLAAQFVPSMAKVQEIWDRGGEGAIIKKLSAKYSPGWRSPDWVKVKAVLSATLLITGFKNGKNGPYSIVELRDDHGIETTVKTLNNEMMRQFQQNPTAYIGKKLVISYHERLPKGKYRHPMFDHLAGVGE